jgi:adenylate cyclase
MDERTTALFTDAEQSVERFIGQLRLAMALSLRAVFVVAVVTHAQRDDAVLAVQITVASATIVAYLALGALSYHVAAPISPMDAVGFRYWRCRFPALQCRSESSHHRSWWQLCRRFSGGLARANSPRVRRAAIQPRPAVLRHGTPGGRLAIAAADFGFDTLADTPPAAIGRFFDAPPNIMRLAILIAAGVILLAAAARTRSLMQRAINEARRGANLTRYLRQKSSVNWPKSGLTALHEGRRQAVAVMFVDIRGFTTLMETMDPAAAGRLLAGFRRLVVATATRCDGVVDKFVGDAAMLVLGLPSPRPDDARRALSCARALLAGAPGEWARDVEAGRAATRRSS